jgi:hypothetical protein
MNLHERSVESSIFDSIELRVMDKYNPQQQWQSSSALNHALPKPSPQASQLSTGFRHGREAECLW